jgi:hypothetical protein
MRKNRLDIIREFHVSGEEFHTRNTSANLEAIRIAGLKAVEEFEAESDKYQVRPRGNEAIKAFRGGYDKARERWIANGKPDIPTGDGD